MLTKTVDRLEIGERGRSALVKLSQSLDGARIYSQDYEVSEMRDEQLDNAKKAKRYLEQARQAILRASEFNIFGAIDVAHLTAQIDQAKADLK